MRRLLERVQNDGSPVQAHGGTRRACQFARVQPVRLQSAHQTLSQDPLHQEAHGGLQLQVRAMREDVQGAVGLHDPREGPRHGVLRVRHMRLLLSEQKLPLLPQTLQAQDEGEEVSMPDLQEEVQDAEESRQSHGTAQDQVRLRAMRDGVQEQIRPHQASEDSFRGEILFVRDLRQDIRVSELAEDPSVDARRRTTLRLRHMRAELHAEVAHDAASQEASGSASASPTDQNNESASRCTGQNNREQERQVNATKSRWTMYILSLFFPRLFFSFFLIFFLLFFFSLCLMLKLEGEKYEGEREHRFWLLVNDVCSSEETLFSSSVEAFPCETNCVPLGRSIFEEG